MTTFKHLTHEQRVLIEDRLNKHISIRKIAAELEKSPSTILREIANKKIIIYSSKNHCIHRRYCDIQHLCNDLNCNNKCSKCIQLCSNYCSKYEKAICPKLSKSPYICNGCKNYHFCEYDKFIYSSVDAYKQYKTTLSDSRSGFDISEEELIYINELVTPLIRNGQSPYHIITSNKDKIHISETTLRRMIDKCVLDARNIDLREQVKRKPRNKQPIVRLSTSKIGHFYCDYLDYISKNDANVTEMDCVEGLKNEGATLLTLTLKNLSFQLAFIMNKHDSSSVIETLDKIETALGFDLFHAVFGVILTDNGAEFADIERMERSCLTNKKRCIIFFCEPNRSDQKGTCENHHRMIRYILPKGSSFEHLYQSDVNLIMNHINSYKRKALYGRSAFNLAKMVLPEDFFILLGLEEIPSDQIILSPKLLQSK
ncbi:MAG: IS30 family transposase [Lachnospiraceae bacterium]|nr:IS30 family transposase [Lachnospiraceae bacterium]